MHIISMDIHRSFAQVAILEDGRITDNRRVELVRHLIAFARTLRIEDEVVIGATGNSAAVERVLRLYVRRVRVADSRMVRAIADARVKTDKIDATILAKLHASGFLPESETPPHSGSLTTRPFIAADGSRNAWRCSIKWSG